MRFLSSLLDLLYPPKCVFCGRVLKSGDICRECELALPYTKGDAEAQKLPFVKLCVSPLYYEDMVRDSFLRYKFGGNESYSVRYGAILAECIQKNLDCGSLDVISFIPLSRKRLRKRGYNQAELLAREVSRLCGVKCEPLLKKIKSTPAQSTLRDRNKRTQNVKGAFAAAAEVENITVLLIDDIVTTGATLSEGARVLRQNGAACVYAAALARHRD